MLEMVRQSISKKVFDCLCPGARDVDVGPEDRRPASLADSVNDLDVLVDHRFSTTRRSGRSGYRRYLRATRPTKLEQAGRQPEEDDNAESAAAADIHATWSVWDA
jgi:hypothetical protein